MTAPHFAVSALDGRDRAGFSCSSDPLNRYFHTQASQDMRRKVASCFIVVDQATDTIAGYYTLSAADIPLTELPPDLTKRLPRYPTLPAARLGRLAVDHRYLRQKLGALLLADAVMRAAASEVAVYAMVVDAKDEGAEAFYRHHGLVAYASMSGKLMAPLGRLLVR